MRAALWFTFFLVGFDLLLGFAFDYPERPDEPPPSFLQRYFEYGRSVEGKLRRIENEAVWQSSPAVARNWLAGIQPDVEEAAKGASLVVSGYGMSFLERLMQSIDEVDSSVAIRQFNAPGAPASWSYSAFARDTGRAKTDAAILAVMTEGVPALSATAGWGINFESSFPYTFPRYYPEGDVLREENPPFLDLKGFTEHLHSPSKMTAYQDWLIRHDAVYDWWTFEENASDSSSLLRLLRRAYAQYQRRRLRAGVFDTSHGRMSDQVLVLRGLVRKFASTARTEGILPVVYLVNNMGHGTVLHDVLEPVLLEEEIPYLSSHRICPPDDPRVFQVGDGHFLPRKDRELAGAMLRLIRSQLELEESRRR